MSGPKIDYVQLERQRQAELERQRRERLRLMEERQRLLLGLDTLTSKSQKAITENISEVKRISAIKLEVAAHQIKRNEALQELRQAGLSLSQLVVDLRAQTGRRADASAEGNHHLREFLSEAQEKLERVLRKTQAAVDQSMQDIQNYGEQQERARELTGTTYRHVETIALLPLRLTGRVNAGKTLSEQTQRYETLKPFIQSALDHSRYLFAQDRKDFLAALDQLNKGVAGNDAVQITAAMAWMAMSVAAKDRQAQMNMALYARYSALWEQVQGLRGTARSPCPGFGAFASDSALQDACSKLDREADKLNQAAYIRALVEEVVRLFGYRSLKPVVLYEEQDVQRRDARGNHFISLSEDARRALHVRISQEGDLMMEVAVASPSAEHAIETGQPMLSGAVDSRTVDVAVAEQQAFCDDHPRMLAELEKRGVHCQEKRHNPSGQAFAFCLHDASQPADMGRQRERTYAELRQNLIDDDRR